MIHPVEQLSVNLIEQYYDNDLSLFWKHMAEDVIWLGPATKQYVEGKQQLKKLYSKENHNLHFALTNMTGRLIPGTANCCEVLLRYTVYTHFENGFVTRDNQRVTFFWRRQKDHNWYYTMLHISNGMDNVDDRDTIYPIHLDDHLKKQSIPPVKRFKRERIMLYGADHGIHYIHPDEICYVEALQKRCKIHTFDASFFVLHMIKEIADLLGDGFYRPHRSFLVNVAAVKKISHSEITMLDGSLIPVPQKKYNQIRADLDHLMHNDDIT